MRHARSAKRLSRHSASIVLAKRGPPETAVSTIENETQKASEWLDDFDGHDILGADVLEDLKTKCGTDFGIKPISKAEMQKQLDDEGRGGYLNGDGPYIPALWIAEHIANHLIGYTPMAFGRGTSFRQCVSALKKAGH